MNADILSGIVVGAIFALVFSVVTGGCILRAVINDRDREEQKLNSEILKKQGYAIEWMRKYEALKNSQMSGVDPENKDAIKAYTTVESVNDLPDLPMFKNQAG